LKRAPSTRAQKTTTTATMGMMETAKWRIESLWPTVTLR
jgi:hypothetical protein